MKGKFHQIPVQLIFAGLDIEKLSFIAVHELYSSDCGLPPSGRANEAQCVASHKHIWHIKSHLNVFVIPTSVLGDSSVVTFLPLTVTMWCWHKWTLGGTSGTFVLREGRSHQRLFIDPECVSRPGLLFIIGTLIPSTRGHTSAFQHTHIVDGTNIQTERMWLFTIHISAVHKSIHCNNWSYYWVYSHTLNINGWVTTASGRPTRTEEAHARMQCVGQQWQWVLLPKAGSYGGRHHG